MEIEAVPAREETSAFNNEHILDLRLCQESATSAAPEPSLHELSAALQRRVDAEVPPDFLAKAKAEQARCKHRQQAREALRSVEDVDKVSKDSKGSRTATHVMFLLLWDLSCPGGKGPKGTFWTPSWISLSPR